MGVLNQVKVAWQTYWNTLHNRSPNEIGVQMMQPYNSMFLWDGDLYQSDIVRAAIRPYVHAIGKLVAKQLRYSVGPDGKQIMDVNPNPWVRKILDEPNPYMTGQKMQEWMATQLALNGNAFALIIRSDDGVTVKQIQPIMSSNVEAIYDTNGDLTLRFCLMNGKIVEYPYSEIIHLRGDYGGKNDLFGASPVKMLLPLMEVVSTTDKGIVNAIKNSAVIRWLLKLKQSMRQEDISKYTKDFASDFLSAQNGTGVAAVDAKADAVQVTPTDYVPNAAQMDRTTARIYAVFSTNQAIVTSTYTEDQWNAYYENQIEPFVRQFGEEYTRKIFSYGKLRAGNKIVFSGYNLSTASMSTKLGLQAMVDRGALTPDEWREAFNLQPVPGGDVPLRRLDTQPLTPEEIENIVDQVLNNIHERG